MDSQQEIRMTAIVVITIGGNLIKYCPVPAQCNYKSSCFEHLIKSRNLYIPEFLEYHAQLCLKHSDVDTKQCISHPDASTLNSGL